MNLNAQLLRRGLIAAVFCLLTVFARADAATDDSLGSHVATLTVPAGLSAPAVQEAIVSTLLGRRWGVPRKTEDRVVGYLRHRRNEAKVTLVYSATEVQLYCVGWQVDKKTGTRQKPELPKGWLENIQGDLTVNLNRAAAYK